MKSINKVMLLGNLTKDPEKRAIQGGSSVTTFSMATNRKWKNNSGEMQEEVQFHNIVAWGKLADVVAEYCSKGQPIIIEGRIVTRNYEAKDGTKRYVTEIVASEVNLLPSGKQKEKPAAGGEISIDDIPFN